MPRRSAYPGVTARGLFVTWSRVAGVVVAGDQATKYWITHHVAVGTIRRILSGEVLVWNNPNSLTADGVFLGVPPW